jgi:hypothetical protein
MNHSTVVAAAAAVAASAVNSLDNEESYHQHLNQASSVAGLIQIEAATQFKSANSYSYDLINKF